MRQQILHGIVKWAASNPKNDPILTHLSTIAAEMLECEFEDMLSKTRKGKVVMARALVMYVMYQVFGSGFSSLYITRFFNLKCHDGSTARHHRYKMEVWKQDGEIANMIISLEEILLDFLKTNEFDSEYIDKWKLKNIIKQYESTRSNV